MRNHSCVRFKINHCGRMNYFAFKHSALVSMHRERGVWRIICWVTGRFSWDPFSLTVLNMSSITFPLTDLWFLLPSSRVLFFCSEVFVLVDSVRVFGSSLKQTCIFAEQSNCRPSNDEHFRLNSWKKENTAWNPGQIRLKFFGSWKV